MVLEEASAPFLTTSDSLDSPLEPDRDPYDDGSTPSRIQIDLRNISRPLLGELRGYDQAYLAKMILKRCLTASNAAGRPLTQDEATAMTEHTGRYLDIASYGPPVGFAAGFYRAYMTRRSYRFPFYKMDQATFDPKKFLGLPGSMAPKAWQICRFHAYGALGILFGTLLIGNYAVAVTTTQETFDPRLRSLNLEMVERVKHQQAYPAANNKVAQPARSRSRYGDDDDASPAATTGFGGNEQSQGDTDQESGGQVQVMMEDASSMTGQSTEGGSAWDRLRRQTGSSGGSASPFPSTTRSSSNTNPSPTRHTWAERRQAALQKDGQQEDSSDLFGDSESQDR
ncbi:MAG: hypothetical protein M1816_001237 [Peltula sp. TS41687]|nr:MAG: hypothetical protein M1816_001237 [Peltula sp. TS41687]